MSERYTYEVRPHLPIKELIPGRVIKRPCTTKLTKEEVLICMKYGPVYRVFPGKPPIRVFGSNIDQLHTPTFNTAKISSLESNHTQNLNLNARAQEGVSNEPITEAIREAKIEENQDTSETEKISEVIINEPEIAIEEVKEEVVEDTTVVDEITETSIVEEDPVDEVYEEEEADIDYSQDVVKADHPQTIKVNTNNNFHKKNKRH